MGNWVTVVLDASFKWLFIIQLGVTSQKTCIFFVWVIKLLMSMRAYIVWLMIATTCHFVWRWLCYISRAVTRSFPHCLWARLWDLYIKNVWNTVPRRSVVYSDEREHVGVLIEKKQEYGARLETSSSKSVTWFAQYTFYVPIISTRWKSTVVFSSIRGKQRSWTTGDRSWSRTEFCRLLPWWGSSWKIDPTHIMCSPEAWFLLGGYVNCHNKKN